MSTDPAPQTSVPTVPAPQTSTPVVPPVSVPEPTTPDEPEAKTVSASGGVVSIAVSPGATQALARRGISIKGSGDAAYVDGALILPILDGTLATSRARGALRLAGTISFVDRDGFGIDLNGIEIDLTDRALRATVNEVPGSWGSVRGLGAPAVSPTSWTSEGGRVRLGEVFGKAIGSALGKRPLSNFELGTATVAADLK